MNATPGSSAAPGPDQRARGESVEDIRPDLIFPTGKRKGRNPSRASIYRALAEHDKREQYLEAVEQAPVTIWHGEMETPEDARLIEALSEKTQAWQLGGAVRSGTRCSRRRRVGRSVRRVRCLVRPVSPSPGRSHLVEDRPRGAQRRTADR